MYFPSTTVQLYTIDCTNVYFVITPTASKKRIFSKYVENYHNKGVRAPHFDEGCPKDVQRCIVICRMGGREETI